ncbi:MAG: DUF4349 domain-containing protein [Oscillospiraceae bacterium]|jgi:hypothetical protein|nr:DUF4349 domain-containing protein [Oscillospiraceae bacterium]
MKQRIRVLSLAAALLALLFLTACGSGVRYTSESAPAAVAPGGAGTEEIDRAPMTPSPAYDAADGKSDAGGLGTATTQTQEGYSFTAQSTLLDPGRKLIREAALVVETTDFIGGTTELEQLCASAGGYVESSTVPGLSLAAGTRALRSAHYLFRIPVGEYAHFVQTAGQVGNLLSRTETSEDITDRYFDTEAHLKVLMLRRDRLLVLLEAATDSESIVDFEQSLSDTQYEIERLTGTLQKYDALVSYATVDVTLQEVVAYSDPQAPAEEPKTTGERIKRQFLDSVHAIGDFFVALFVFFAGNILYLLLTAILLALLVLFIRRLIRKSRARPAKPAPAPARMYPAAPPPAHWPAPPAAPTPAPAVPPAVPPAAPESPASDKTENQT